MTNSDVKLKNFALKVLPTIESWLMYEYDGEYILFNRYSIRKTDRGFEVERYRDSKKYHFDKLRNAGGWCILDNKQLHYAAFRVIELDAMIASAEFDKLVYLRLMNNKSVDKFIVDVKFQKTIDNHKKFRTELDKYIELAKAYQMRGFENETTRYARK
jgi:hypothetical protein